MDKYQEYLFKSIRVNTQPAAKPAAKTPAEPAAPKDFIFKEGKITLTQNDNYNFHQYEIAISHPIINEIWCLKNNNKIVGDNVNEVNRKIRVDFNDKSTAIFVSFKNNLVDPIAIPVHSIDADTIAWDNKMLEEQKKKIEEIVNIKITTGDSLINVLYNPLNEKYSYAVVSLYYDYAFTKQGKETKTYQMMGKYTSEKEKFFIPIINLGYASYAIELRQYDTKNKMIYKSDKIEFSLKREITAVWDRIPTVRVV